MLKLLIANLIMKLGDIGTTYYLVDKYGIEGEANPIVRWSMQQFGLEVALVINFLFVFSLLVVAYKFLVFEKKDSPKKKPEWILIIPLLMMTGVVISNFVIIWNG